MLITIINWRQRVSEIALGSALRCERSAELESISRDLIARSEERIAISRELLARFAGYTTDPLK